MTKGRKDSIRLGRMVNKTGSQSRHNKDHADSIRLDRMVNQILGLPISFTHVTSTWESDRACLHLLASNLVHQRDKPVGVLLEIDNEKRIELKRH